MNVISYKAIREFVTEYPGAELVMLAWFKDVSHCRWHNWSELKADYSSADAVGDDRVVFNLGGNKYRIVARVAYAPHFRLMIKFVGTHKQYDRIKARTV